nr:MAG: hypothetical protein [Bacteriophage sp.]
MEKKIKGISEAELLKLFEKELEYSIIEFISEKGNTLSEEEVEYLLQDIDFEESHIYETLSNHNWTVEKVLSIPQLAKKVNHIGLWFNLDDEFKFNKDTTLEEYEDYIYDELGLDIEDYMIEEIYNTAMDNLKNED